MAKIEIVRVDCDTVECDAYAEVPNRPGAATTLRDAGWTVWQRGTRTFDMCAECDTVMMTGMTPPSTKSRRLRSVG